MKSSHVNGIPQGCVLRNIPMFFVVVTGMSGKSFFIVLIKKHTNVVFDKKFMFLGVWKIRCFKKKKEKLASTAPQLATPAKLSLLPSNPSEA